MLWMKIVCCLKFILKFDNIIWIIYISLLFVILFFCLLCAPTADKWTDKWRNDMIRLPPCLHLTLKKCCVLIRKTIILAEVIKSAITVFLSCLGGVETSCSCNLLNGNSEIMWKMNRGLLFIHLAWCLCSWL